MLLAYGLTQVAFARELGVRNSTLSEWLSGKKHLDVNIARTIRARWHVSLDYLYCGDHGSLPHNLAHAVVKGVPLPRE